MRKELDIAMTPQITEMMPKEYSITAGIDKIKKYLAGIFLLISLIVLSVFGGFALRSNQLVYDELLSEGRSFFREIVLTREWVASHGGVYVKLEPGMEVNPYLNKIPGLQVVIRGEDGQLLTLKNPALMTREISELAKEKGLFEFKITSLKPLNPHNGPDAFERRSLESFERGFKEQSLVERTDKGAFYRYMAPLRADAPCLRCHASQGYGVGDVRGGISVSIPANESIQNMHMNWLLLALIAFGIILSIFAIIFFISSFFIKDLRSAEQKLIQMAAHDPLTNLLNRREGFKRIETEHHRCIRLNTGLSVMMIDIDHFKRINDTQGHRSGDLVIREVSHILKNCVRGYDVVCRYGGEEFLIAMPDVALEQAAMTAERIRQVVEQREVILENQTVARITVSLGVSHLQKGETVETLIALADESLYEAKNRGRNRVCTKPGEGRDRVTDERTGLYDRSVPPDRLFERIYHAQSG
jgi:diguanylate cyclase (GGDEF)-like protein